MAEPVELFSDFGYLVDWFDRWASTPLNQRNWTLSQCKFPFTERNRSEWMAWSVTALWRLICPQPLNEAGYSHFLIH